MRNYLFGIILMFYCLTATATTTFDATTNTLTVDTVSVNNAKFRNAVLKLTDFKVVSMGANSAVTATCPSPTDTFDPSTNTLTLNAVIANSTQYNNVVLNLVEYQVISVVSDPAVTPTPTPTPIGACSDINFTDSIFNAIKLGMTLDQVNQTIGCIFDPSFTVGSSSFTTRKWVYLNGSTIKVLSVDFDPKTNIVIELPIKLGF